MPSRSCTWVWPYLTAEQRQAAATLIDRPTATGRSSRAQSMPSARLAGWSAGDGTAVLPAVFSMPGDDTQAYNYDQLAANANQILVDHLGGSGIKFKVDIEWGTPTGTEYAHTTSWWRATAVADSFDPKEAPGYEDYVPFFGEYKHFLDNGCHLTVWNQKFKAVDGIDAQAILVHEMYHCWENRLAGTYQTMASVKPWIAEGEPTWAMAAALAGVGGILDESWNGYVFGPTVQYDTRKYDGVGVFGHMSDLTNADDVWSKLLPVFAAGEDDRNASALVRLMQGHDHDFFTSWGSSYFLDKDHERWTMGGPGQPPEHGPPATPVTVNDGFNAGLTSAPPTTAELFSISGDADIVAVSLYGGYARLHDKEYGLETELTPEAPVVLCIKSGGCKCPDGSDGASLFTRRATAPVSIGLDGGNMTGQIGLLGKSLDEFCKKPDDPSQPPPPPGGGGGGGGGGTPDNTPDWPGPDGATYGDPHVQTFDGTYLEFQRVGEYTLARSTKDDFTVQVRQVPVGTGRWASVNQAVATKIGGQRATVTLEKGSDGPEDVLRLDGAVVSGNPPALTGGTITRALTAFGTNYTFEWPDGTVLHANQLGGYAINVRLEPSAARRGNLEGLLGNDDGKPENDETAVPALADRWLVKSAASLFDYAPGQSSATFIDPDFPDPNAVIPNRDAAERDCREEGLTDPQLLHNCVIDFAVTNGFLFRDQYAHQQAVLAARAAFGAVPASPAAADHRVVLMQGAVTDQTMTPAQSFTAQAGDILYVAQTPDCVDRDKESWHVPGLVLYFHLYQSRRPGGGLRRAGLRAGPARARGVGHLHGEGQRHEGRDRAVPRADHLRAPRPREDRRLWRNHLGDHRTARGARPLHLRREGGRPRADRGKGLPAQWHVHRRRHPAGGDAHRAGLQRGVGLQGGCRRPVPAPGQQRQRGLGPVPVRAAGRVEPLRPAPEGLSPPRPASGAPAWHHPLHL